MSFLFVYDVCAILFYAEIHLYISIYLTFAQPLLEKNNELFFCPGNA